MSYREMMRREKQREYWDKKAKTQEECEEFERDEEP